ncbi:hypothetical protein JDV02_005654 [Purpureocillium takamizusanense]|uniref:Uncharacterized protein n=1 Tax=Purpureocillium takamizusanense TaxID=2060973 RepID=A0A9Q8VC48_9HYPO|nr:uncharacterized protein JDV02_005654 [Purpureocillium takamizusanense]UNI19472.1 hypothetical protein JDV02_005654 [Purpureocillium takamizusanense]
MRTHALSLATVAAAGLCAAARQASNYNVTASEAQAHDCGRECQRILGLTNAADLDVVGRDFDFGFYETAGNFSRSGSRPGDVLKVQPMDPEARTFRAGTAAFKFQYVTVDLDGGLVPATGFIAFPYSPGMGGARGAATADDDDDDEKRRRKQQQQRNNNTTTNNNTPYKLVAWAHGTIGLYAGCAPSNGPNMFDYTSWQPLTARGYAVVGTDYAGLGNNATAHKYCSFDAHATDVYYSVVAARKLFGGGGGALLSREWLSVGHSQGGGTAWKLAESELVRHDEGYLGSVALSPATYVVDMFLGGLTKGGAGNSSNSNNTGGGGGDGGSGIDRNVIKYPGYLPYLPLAVERANPAFRSTLLSATMRRRVQLAEAKQMCSNALMGLTFDLFANDGPLVNTTGGIAHDAPYMLDWQARHAPALPGARSPAPVLVVQGLADTSVLAPTTERAWNASCAAGNAVHLRLYPGVEHSPLPAAAEAEWMGWIDWRFAGGRYAHETKEGDGGEGGGGGNGNLCSRVTRRAPFGGRWTKTPPEFRLPKFLGGGGGGDNKTAGEL